MIKKFLLSLALLVGFSSVSVAQNYGPTVYHVATMQDLTKMTSASLGQYKTIILDGYYAGNSSGGGTFTWLTAAQASGLTPDGGVVIAPSDHPGVCTSGCLVRQIAGNLSVLDYGADPTGTADSSSAWNSYLAYIVAHGGHYVAAPPGSTFLFSTTLSSPYSYYDPASVVVNCSDAGNFSLDMSGVTFNTDSGIANSEKFIFNRCRNFSLKGGVFNGINTNTEENGAIVLASVVNFDIGNMSFPSGYDKQGAPIIGDYWVNGSIHDLDEVGVFTGADAGMFYNVKFDHIHMTGLFNSNPGSAGFQQVNNSAVPSADNHTGYSFSESSNVTFAHSDISNFNTGISLVAGTGFHVLENSIYSNPGTSPSTRGIGILVSYNASGQYSSVGYPVTDVDIVGNVVSGNGATEAGDGILIDGSAIANSDRIANIAISDNQIIGNASTGVDVLQNGSTHTVNNVTVTGNVIPQVSPQTACLGSGINGVVNDSNAAPNALAVENSGCNPFGASAAFLGDLPGTGSANAIVNHWAYPVLLTVATSTAAYELHVIDPEGHDANMGTVGANSGPVSVVLQPGAQWYTNTAVPSAGETYLER